MKISIQTFVTRNNAITIESGEHELTRECTQEIKKAVEDLQMDPAAKKVRWLFGGA